MAKKTKKSAENIAAQTAALAVETTPTVTPKLFVAQRKFNRWYVYFKGVAPKDNVGCGCKTAKSAIRYMHLLKARYGTIPNHGERPCSLKQRRCPLLPEV